MAPLTMPGCQWLAHLDACSCARLGHDLPYLPLCCAASRSPMLVHGCTLTLPIFGAWSHQRKSPHRADAHSYADFPDCFKQTRGRRRAHAGDDDDANDDDVDDDADADAEDDGGDDDFALLLGYNLNRLSA